MARFFDSDPAILPFQKIDYIVPTTVGGMPWL
jgi:hypothetical protein